MATEIIKLLLVEDDKIDQRSFQRLVDQENLPYDYMVAGSLSDALDVLSQHQFDIIIVDYQLGDGTGFDVLAAVDIDPVHCVPDQPGVTSLEPFHGCSQTLLLVAFWSDSQSSFDPWGTLHWRTGFLLVVYRRPKTSVVLTGSIWSC